MGVWHLAEGLSPHAWQDAGDNVEGQKGQGQVILISHKYSLISQAPNGNSLPHHLTSYGSHGLPSEIHQEITGGPACPPVALSHNCIPQAWLFTM